MSYDHKPTTGEFAKDVAKGVAGEVGGIVTGVADGLLEIATLGLHKSQMTKDYEASEAKKEQERRCNCDD